MEGLKGEGRASRFLLGELRLDLLDIKLGVEKRDVLDGLCEKLMSKGVRCR